MSAIFLIRHGQAGLRDNYDTLSDLGRGQVKLLGEYWSRQKMRVDVFYSGSLKRQRQTAEELCAACSGLPDPVVNPLWDEFDLSAVYDGIAPQLATDDAEFRAHYEAMVAEAADADSAVHRRWTASDIAVVRAWVEGRYHYAGESWVQFTARVSKAMEIVRQTEAGRDVAISTSATPIGVAIGGALELGPRQVMRVAGALLNSSFSSLLLRDGDARLFSFNQAPHLESPELRTFR